MPDTRRTLSALQAIINDNTSGDISAQDVRDFLVSVFPTGDRLLYSATISSQASLDMLTRNASYESGDLFQSDFPRYRFEIDLLVPATAGANILMQLSSDGGSTWVTTGYKRTYLYVGSDSSSGSAGSTGDTGFLFCDTLNTGTGASGTATLCNPRTTTLGKSFFGDFIERNNTNSNWFRISTGIFLDNQTAMNAARLIASTGNLTSGNVRCYGHYTP